jgi:hypothetical protein
MSLYVEFLRNCNCKMYRYFSIYAHLNESFPLVYVLNSAVRDLKPHKKISSLRTIREVDHDGRNRNSQCTLIAWAVGKYRLNARIELLVIPCIVPDRNGQCAKWRGRMSAGLPLSKRENTHQLCQLSDVP